MRKLKGFLKTALFRLFIFLFFFHFSVPATAQFHEYNGIIRTLNYYMLHMEHLLTYQEQTTFLMQDVNSALLVIGTETSATQVSTGATARMNIQNYQAYIARANEGIAENYDVMNFINYYERSRYLPDSLNRLFKKWMKKADSVAIAQNTIANDVIKLLARYNLSFGDKKADIRSIHALIKQYHTNLKELQQIRNKVTGTSLDYYTFLETKKKYPFAIYKKACEHFLRINIYFNNYFEYADEKNEEQAVVELKKLSREIQDYLANEYTYRTYNNQLPGFHVFPLEEDAHNEISYSLKEIAFQIKEYINSGRTEQVDSVFFRKKMNDVLNIIHAISFSHDMNLNVQNNQDIPTRYHATLKAILRFDFLRPRYDLYHNAGGNSSTSAMPLAWCRYVYTFNYIEPKEDSIYTAPPAEVKAVDAPLIEKERETIVVQTIRVDTDSVLLTFYDNAEVDNDTISILVNGTTIAESIKLNLTPYQVVVKMDKVNKEKLVTIFANNLGTIPPNTAYVRIDSGDKIYRLYLFATKKVNAAIKLVYQQGVSLNDIE
jgi:hypothetical protein